MSIVNEIEKMFTMGKFINTDYLLKQSNRLADEQATKTIAHLITHVSDQDGFLYIPPTQIIPDTLLMELHKLGMGTPIIYKPLNLTQLQNRLRKVQSLIIDNRSTICDTVDIYDDAKHEGIGLVEELREVKRRIKHIIETLTSSIELVIDNGTIPLDELEVLTSMELGKLPFQELKEELLEEYILVVKMLAVNDPKRIITEMKINLILSFLRKYLTEHIGSKSKLSVRDEQFMNRFSLYENSYAYLQLSGPNGLVSFINNHGLATREVYYRKAIRQLVAL